MRSVIVGLVACGACAWAQDTPEVKTAPGDRVEAERAAEAAAGTRKAAEAYTITTGDGNAATTLTLEPKPLLQWSNPVMGSFHGSVFVWTARGRPEVVASIYKKYLPLPHHLGVEFHSLAARPATARRGDRVDWFPERAGVESRAIPGAPTPAGSPAQRLRQMRALAREFSATKTTRNDVTRDLRLLTQPIYRDAGADPDVPDGALFAFVEGTDPEVFLRIEAHGGRDGGAWHYALARMNSIALRVVHRGQEVWSVPTIPWQQAFNPREPYTLLIFRPGEGANPPEDPPAP